MATLEKIRKRAGVFVAVVIGLALVTFVLGDFMTSGGSMFTNDQYEIAEIAGNSIPAQRYDAKVEHLKEINKLFSGRAALDERMTESIREQAWQQIVKKNVLENEYEELGIVVSDKELENMVWGNNVHPYIKQFFGNPQTGEVDRAAIENFIVSMDQDPSGRSRIIWDYIEKEILTERAYTKYNNLIKKGLYVTDLEADANLIASAKKVDFSYIVKRYNSVADSTINISESDITNYYNNHTNDYKQSASRDVEYVVFPIEPSKDDFADAEKWITDVKSEFETTTDPMDFANANSDVKSPATDYTQDALPVLFKSMFDAEKGSVMGPVLDNKTYKIARLVDIKMIPDSAKARHILIQPLGQDAAAIASAKAKADSLLNAIKSGSDFATLAKEFSKDPGSAPDGGDLGWFKPGTMVKPFNDAVFEGNKNETVVVETNYGFHIINILNVSPKSKRVNIAVIERSVVPSQKTRQTIYAEASKFAGTNRTLETFKAAAAENNYNKRVANYLREGEKNISGLEKPRALVRWAYETELNTVSDIFEFGDNYVVAALSAIREDGIAPIEEVRTQIEYKVKQDKKAEMLITELDKYNNATSIQEIASAENTQVVDANDISFTTFSIPSAGIEPSVIATAVTSDNGVISAPIKGSNGVYIIQINNVKEGTKGDVTEEAKKLLRQLESREYYEAFAALKKVVGVVDKRAKFY